MFPNNNRIYLKSFHELVTNFFFFVFNATLNGFGAAVNVMDDILETEFWPTLELVHSVELQHLMIIFCLLAISVIKRSVGSFFLTAVASY